MNGDAEINVRIKGPAVRRCVSAFIHFFLAACVAGCGRGGPETVSVHGKVTFAGGPCPGPGTIYFAPIEVPEGLPRRPATADFNTDGQFEATSFTPGDGLVPGRYRVTLTCWKEPPKPYGPPAASFTPPGYQPPELAVERGAIGPIEVNYDVR